MFVTFEGSEGVGKSTQLRLLKEYLDKSGQQALYIREPGSTEISEKIRGVILDKANSAMTDMTEALLYAASRAQLVREVIKPALAEGKLVLCDRYIDSSVAYQGYGRELGADVVKAVNANAIDGCMPDVTVFLDLPPKSNWRGTRRADRIEEQPDDFFERVYQGYLAEIALSPSRFVCIKPDFDKFVTSKHIIEALRQKGAIR